MSSKDKIGKKVSLQKNIVRIIPVRILRLLRMGGKANTEEETAKETWQINEVEKRQKTRKNEGKSLTRNLLSAISLVG
jgi:hypothetical protein